MATQESQVSGNKMKTRSDILEYIKLSKARFSDEYGVKRIGLFGSFARDEASSASDIDILIDMPEPTFDKYMDLKFDLEDKLGQSVDLVLIDTIKEMIRQKIEDEAIYA